MGCLVERGASSIQQNIQTAIYITTIQLVTSWSTRIMNEFAISKRYRLKLPRINFPVMFRVTHLLTFLSRLLPRNIHLAEQGYSGD
jgi:hypothetical protein